MLILYSWTNQVPIQQGVKAAGCGEEQAVIGWGPRRTAVAGLLSDVKVQKVSFRRHVDGI